MPHVLVTLSGAAILQEVAERGETSFRLPLRREESLLRTLPLPFVLWEVWRCGPVFRVVW